jgi:hypothetical protein
MSNFGEVSTVVPTGKGNLHDSYRSKGNFSKMDFTDTPPLRTVIDTTKVENLHSTSVIGKTGILGAKVRTSNQTCRSYLGVANVLQDGLLRVAKCPEPKYLPSTLGGCNCPASYGDPVNTYLYMKAFKGGGYDRLYGTAVEEIKEAIRLTESGTPQSVIIPALLRDNHEYAFGTFQNLVLIPRPILREHKDPELPTPIYLAAGVQNNLSSVEGRLIRTRDLVRESEARVLFNRKKRIEDYLLSPVDIPGAEDMLRSQKRRDRAKVGNALHGHTAYMNLLQRKGKSSDVTKLLETWNVCVTGQPEFSLRHAEWLHYGGKGEYLSIVDIPLCENMYLRKEVSGDETLMVENVTLMVQGRKDFLAQTTVARPGLYQITSSMQEWGKQIVAALEASPIRPVPFGDVKSIFYENREWINDDTLLIQRAMDLTASFGRDVEIALVSRDKRLANQMANSTNCRIVLIDPLSLAEAFPTRTWNSLSRVEPGEIYQSYSPSRKVRDGLKIPIEVLIDTGSLRASLEGIQVKPAGLSWKFISTEVIESGWKDKTTRFEVARTEEFWRNPTLRTKMYDHTYFVSGKRKKKHSYPASLSSGTYSWSNSEPISFDSYVVRRQAHTMNH